LFNPFFVYAKDVYCIKVATGCDGNCAYCAIRLAKGKILSKSKDEILAELDDAIRKGYRKFVMAGDEISAYGQDLDDHLSILGVIRLFINRDEVKSLFLESFEPNFMISHFKGIREVLASRKIPVFCSSVQSGSNRILRLMNRNYVVEDFARCMGNIKNSFPWIQLRSEFIVGFPGETEEDFLCSLALVRQLNLDFVRAHIYEDRPKTVASTMADKVPDAIKKRRRRRIIRQHLKNLLLSQTGRA